MCLRFAQTHENNKIYLFIQMVGRYFELLIFSLIIKQFQIPRLTARVISAIRKMKRIYSCSCGFARSAKPQEQRIFFLHSEGQSIFRIAGVIRNMRRINCCCTVFAYQAKQRNNKFSRLIRMVNPFFELLFCFTERFRAITINKQLDEKGGTTKWTIDNSWNI